MSGCRSGGGRPPIPQHPPFAEAQVTGVGGRDAPTAQPQPRRTSRTGPPGQAQSPPPPPPPHTHLHSAEEVQKVIPAVGLPDHLLNEECPLNERGQKGRPEVVHRSLIPRHRPQAAALLHAHLSGNSGEDRDALETGGGGRQPPSPSGAPSLCQAFVSLTASASFDGICNRQ